MYVKCTWESISHRTCHQRYQTFHSYDFFLSVSIRLIKKRSTSTLDHWNIFYLNSKKFHQKIGNIQWTLDIVQDPFWSPISKSFPWIDFGFYWFYRLPIRWSKLSTTEDPEKFFFLYFFFFLFLGAGESGKSTIVKQMK